MKRFGAAASILLALGSLTLGGCQDLPIHWDPLSTNGRDGAGQPVSYEALMRIAAAAHAGGDLATAVGAYRRASEREPTNPAPLVGAGNALADMGRPDDATVAYNSALAVRSDDPEALRGLARSYL